MSNSVHGKTELSFRRKKSNTPASQTPTISSDIKFAHQLSAGDTTIPLNALVLPSQMPSFVNPTSVEIAQANVKANAANLILVSSLKGTLVYDLSYKVVSNTVINLEFEAEENEIIVGQFRATRGVDQLLEGRLWSVTGTLTAGNTDFALGQPFKTNANPNYQVGEFVVFVDGVQQYRNVGNATAAPSADGNYEELDTGGLTNSIRFNQAFGSDVAITVMPSSYIVTTSDLALQPQIDALAGQIDKMIPTLAYVAGVPESTFQGAPNSVDLKSFGDKVEQNKADIETINTVSLPAKQDIFTLKWQKKVMTVANTPSQMNFNNLEIGKTYRLCGQMALWDNEISNANSSNINMDISNGATLIARIRNQGRPEINGGTSEQNFGLNIIFTASSTTLTFTKNLGNLAANETFAILEELPFHTPTTDWT